MTREPKTFRQIKEGSYIYQAIKINDSTYNIQKRKVYTVNKLKTEYGQENIIFFDIIDYFSASPNTYMQIYSDRIYSPNFNNLINHLTERNLSWTLIS